MSVSSANAAPRVNRARWPTYVDATAKRSNGLGDSERRGAYHMVYAMSGSAHLLRSGHHPDARGPAEEPQESADPERREQRQGDRASRGGMVAADLVHRREHRACEPTAEPARARAPGRSPVASARPTGTSAPHALTGETML